MKFHFFECFYLNIYNMIHFLMHNVNGVLLFVLFIKEKKIVFFKERKTFEIHVEK